MIPKEELISLMKCENEGKKSTFLNVFLKYNFKDVCATELIPIIDI